MYLGADRPKFKLFTRPEIEARVISLIFSFLNSRMEIVMAYSISQAVGNVCVAHGWTGCHVASVPHLLAQMDYLTFFFNLSLLNKKIVFFFLLLEFSKSK